MLTANKVGGWVFRERGVPATADLNSSEPGSWHLTRCRMWVPYFGVLVVLWVVRKTSGSRGWSFWTLRFQILQILGSSISLFDRQLANAGASTSGLSAGVPVLSEFVGRLCSLCSPFRRRRLSLGRVYTLSRIINFQIKTRIKRIKL